MVPWARLFITKKITGRPCSTAIGRAGHWALIPPSPTSATTTRSASWSCTPTAAAGPKPIVEAPPGVMNRPAAGSW